jgi:signal transduction histidine kinase
VRGRQWLYAAGVVTWLVCGLRPIADITAGEFGGWRAIAWTIAFLAFGAALCPTMGRPGTPPADGSRFHLALLVIQSVAGLTMVYLASNGTTAAALVIVAAQLPYASPRYAWLWVGVHTVVVFTLFRRFVSVVDALSISIALGGFQLFAVASAFLARSEAAAREQLARANADLHAAHAVLAENSRVAERLRISRELHDSIGHHLTALSLQLDVASRLSDGRAADHVRQAHAITRLLLGDVRDVVSRLRDSSRADLTQALRALASSPGELAVHFDAPDTLVVDDDTQAHALLRGVQEILTNTAKHAGARNLWIRLELLPDGVALHARDDGRGAAAVAWGNGLKGMRERFEEHAGRVDVESTSGGGFEVHAFMPKPGVPSPPRSWP